jgi:DNA-binding CsgD family transcriptional regulator
MITFTPRERQIVQLIITAELSNKEIASKLNISTFTVKTHMANIFRKIGFSNRRQLYIFFKKEI